MFPSHSNERRAETFKSHEDATERVQRMNLGAVGDRPNKQIRVQTDLTPPIQLQPVTIQQKPLTPVASTIPRNDHRMQEHRMPQPFGFPQAFQRTPGSTPTNMSNHPNFTLTPPMGVYGNGGPMANTYPPFGPATPINGTGQYGFAGPTNGVVYNRGSPHPLPQMNPGVFFNGGSHHGFPQAHQQWHTAARRGFSNSPPPGYFASAPKTSSPLDGNLTRDAAELRGISPRQQDTQHNAACSQRNDAKSWKRSADGTMDPVVYSNAPRANVDGRDDGESQDDVIPGNPIPNPSTEFAKWHDQRMTSIARIQGPSPSSGMTFSSVQGPLGQPFQVQHPGRSPWKTPFPSPTEKTDANTVQGDSQNSATPSHAQKPSSPATQGQPLVGNAQGRPLKSALKKTTAYPIQEPQEQAPSRSPAFTTDEFRDAFRTPTKKTNGVQERLVHTSPRHPTHMNRSYAQESQCRSVPAKIRRAGMQQDAVGTFHNLFPRTQLFQPRVEYPMWDENWDNRQPTGENRKNQRAWPARHLLLIRHGHYDETFQEDEKRKLTELGRQQAEVTGKKLAGMVRKADDKFPTYRFKVIRVSDMTRAKETAAIIAKHLPDVDRAAPDPSLNETRPAHCTPTKKSSYAKYQNDFFFQHHRAEEAFKKYFYRATDEDDAAVAVGTQTNKRRDTEFEVFVCHANVIRYLTCRALQLPPEAWKRVNLFHCSITHIKIPPNGHVSCQGFGDAGHLPQDLLSTMHNAYGYRS